MRLAKWGNSLAVRLPATLVRELNLKAGDDINIRWDGDRLPIGHEGSADRIIAELRKFRGTIRAADLPSRDEANER